MCGICGIWNQSDPETLAAMVDKMHHRGPDDHGVFCDEKVSIGMARLAIIDLTPSGHQPMSIADGKIWIVFNGEIYNFQSERSLLEKQGVTFHSHSDTEVVLRLYERYGDDFIVRLRGMFAFAIYDKRGGPGRERMLLARDPLGIKPLLYSQVGGKFVFASEIKSLLRSGLVERQVDPDALRLLLTFGSIYQPHTILKDVKILPPAHRMVISNGRVHMDQYWNFDTDRIADLRTRSYDDQVDAVAEMMKETVQLHMVSDVPVGAFLSGGVDSSLLVGLMTRIAGRRIKTFSVGFESEGSHLDETDQAGRTAQFLGAEHTRVVVTGEDLRRHIFDIAAGLDQPTVDGVNSYFVSQAARQAVTVAISGTGGDEVFAGYPWFTQMVAVEQRQRSKPLEGMMEELRGWYYNHPRFDPDLLGPRGDILQMNRSRYGFLQRYAQTYNIYGPLSAGRLLSSGIRAAAQTGKSMARDIRHFDELRRSPAVERVSALVMRGYLGNQLLRDIDAASMAHSLEVRVPFLDVPLINLAFSLPVSSKIGDVRQVSDSIRATYRETGCKKILVDAGCRMGVLREDIDDQPKRGFSFPFESWLAGPLKPVMEDALSPSVVKARGWLDSDTVQSILTSFYEQKLGWAYPWLLMMVELWAREVLDQS